MPESRAAAEALLVATIDRWVTDPDGDVVYAEQVEESWVVRMRQTTRDFTSVWFAVGERSIQVEAYVAPAPAEPTEAFRQCLVRNHGTWRVRFALDPRGGIVLRGRVALEHLSEDELEYVLAECHQLVEQSFRPLLRSREK